MVIFSVAYLGSIGSVTPATLPPVNFPDWKTNNVSGDEFMAALRFDTRTFDVTAASQISHSLVPGGANRNWHGFVAAKNGTKLYGIPNNATRVLEVDITNPSSPTFSLIGDSFSAGGSKWNGGALATNDKIYCAPLGANQILVIDPTATPATAQLIGPNLTTPYGINKWSDTVMAQNGKLYGIPYTSTNVLEIDASTDPLTLVVSTTAVMTGNGKWVGGVLAPNGRIYCLPNVARTVLVIDPTNINSTSTIDLPAGTFGSWYGGALAPNGSIYAAPMNATQVLEIDPVNSALRLFGRVFDTSFKWIGSVLAPDGNVYGIPRNATKLLKIVPGTDDADEAATADIGVGTNDKWANGVIAADGRLYCTPWSATTVLVVGVSGGLNENRVLSRYLNS